MYLELETLVRKANFLAKFMPGEGPPEGLTDAEVEELRAAQGSAALPEEYREFLKVFGRRGSQYTQDLRAFPDGPSFKEWLREGLAEAGVDFSLAGAFVLGHHGGYTFWWLHDAAGPRPFVLIWTESWAEPRPIARDFRSFLALIDRDGDRLLSFDIEAVTGRKIRVPDPSPLDPAVEREWAIVKSNEVVPEEYPTTRVEWKVADGLAAPMGRGVPSEKDVRAWMAEVANRRSKDAEHRPPVLTQEDIEEANELWPLG
ncbi:MAG: SMI1/KNR4 family protein [Sulfitobacter sp.]|nr:SMI1/KNR4 family protein [Sulfitobacter sp.]